MTFEKRPETQLAATAWAAGAEAAGRAVEQSSAAVGGEPGLVLVFPEAAVPARESARQAAEAAPGCPVAGMTSDGTCPTDDGLRGPGCTAVAFRRELEVGIGWSAGAARDLRGAGRSAATAALEQAKARTGHSVLLLFVDPDAGNQAAMIDGAYSVARGRVPLAGGGANGRHPELIAGEQVGRDAVVAVAITSPEPVSVGQGHGCRPLADPAIVTSTDGRALRELDGRSAERVYLEGLGRPDADLGDEEFEALAVLHPLAQPQLRGDLRLRHVRGRDPGGGLACSTPIPANAAVWFTQQTPETIVASAGAVVREATGLLGAPARAGLVFDCAARRRAVGSHLPEEVDSLRNAFGPGVPFTGLYTRGEVGRTLGARGDRNHSIVVVAFA